jgi:hypothetical protein
LDQLSEGAEEAKLVSAMKPVSKMTPATPTSAVNGTESKSEGHPGNAAAIQSPESPIPAPAPEVDRPGEAHENPPTESGPRASSQNVEDERPPEQPLSHKEKSPTKETRQERTWLMGDPQGWVGRRIRSRRNMALYTVNQVYNNGRVSLERNWMSYFTDIETVRKDYDTYC